MQEVDRRRLPDGSRRLHRRRTPSSCTAGRHQLTAVGCRRRSGPRRAGTPSRTRPYRGPPRLRVAPTRSPHDRRPLTETPASAPTPAPRCSACAASRRASEPSHVLHGVDLDVRPGQVTALVGDNGAGKSTLIKGIAGIHALRRGRVPLRGQARHVHGPRTPTRSASRSSTRTSRCATTSTWSTTCSSAARSAASRLLDEDAMEARARETLDGLSVRTLQSVRHAGRVALRWPAADRRDRPRGAVELQARRSSTSPPPPSASPRPSRCSRWCAAWPTTASAWS